MDELERNNEIFHLLNLWAWCSRALHVKWERSDKYRNSCLAGHRLCGQRKADRARK